MNKCNSERSTVVIVLVTILLTLLVCFVFQKIMFYKSVLEFGHNTENNFNKLAIVKSVVDSSYLRDYDEEKVEDETIRGMLKGLDDPYAAYYNKKDFENFFAETEGEYEGIGIYVGYDEEKHMPIVITPIINSPAAEAGILPGDYIEYVGDVQALNVSYEELIDEIKGKEGTKVKIGLLRTKEDKTVEEIEKEVERKNIDINPVTEEVFDDTVGYIKLTSFDETSVPEFKKRYNNLINNRKVKGLILDLRNNPGGILDVCTKITDMLVPKGKIVYTLDKAGKEEAIYSDSKQIEIPLVILINEGSASASEVLTGAVKDYGVGKIIGTKSYGKGVVQTLKHLGDGTYIKLTTSEYFSPKGNNIDGKGIEPDIVVELPEDIENPYNIPYKEDTQLQAAIKEIKSQI